MAGLFFIIINKKYFNMFENFTKNDIINMDIFDYH